MADNKKWAEISSDEEDHDDQHQHQGKNDESQEQREQRDHQQRQYGEKKPYQKRPYQNRDNKQEGEKKRPMKSDVIDEIKKLDTKEVSLNIFKVDFNATAKDIYAVFNDIKIKKIFLEKPGQFTVDFDNHSDAIAFINAIPRPINGRNFWVQMSMKKQKGGWTEVDNRNKPLVTRESRKTNDYASKKTLPNYNRKQADENAGFDVTSSPQREIKSITRNEEGDDEEKKDDQQRSTFTKGFKTNNYNQGGYKKEGQTGYKKPYQPREQNKDKEQNPDDQTPSEPFKPRGFFKGGAGDKDKDNKPKENRPNPFGSAKPVDNKAQYEAELPETKKTESTTSNQEVKKEQKEQVPKKVEESKTEVKKQEPPKKPQQPRQQQQQEEEEEKPKAPVDEWVHVGSQAAQKSVKKEYNKQQKVI